MPSSSTFSAGFSMRCVTALGSGVDEAVRRVSTAFDGRGSVARIGTYDHPNVGQGTVVNEVVFEYDPAGGTARRRTRLWKSPQTGTSGGYVVELRA